MKPSRLLVLSLLIAASPLAAWAAPAVSDRQIKETVESTYNYRTVLHDQVEIDVEEGVVELTGTVNDKSLKQLAEDTVRSVPGVVDVRNQILVSAPPPEHSDAWIALKVRTALLLNSDVSLARTEVDVADGVVTLTGTADTLAQKELTESFARGIEGVKDIVNRIVVENPVEPRRTMSEVIDDASITARVKYELLTHRSTSALGTNVTTKDGIVTITGEAGNTAEKTLVTRLAQGVKGVKSVTNDMTVKGRP